MELEKPAFVRAEIRYRLGGNRLPVAVEDTREVSKLLSFFPGAGSGAESLETGLWGAWLNIEATRQDGSVIQIFVDSDLERWSDKDGDWPLQPGFRRYLRSLLGPDVTAPW